MRPSGLSMPSIAKPEPFGLKRISIVGVAVEIHVLGRDLSVRGELSDKSLVGVEASLSVGYRHSVNVADIHSGEPWGLHRRDSRADHHRLVTADSVEGQRRAFRRHLVHDLTVREKSGLDERLEAVAYAEHETVAVLDEVCDGVLDARVSQHRGDELTGAVRARRLRRIRPEA